jgi:hypothetical protein
MGFDDVFRAIRRETSASALVFKAAYRYSKSAACKVARIQLQVRTGNGNTVRPSKVKSAAVPATVSGEREILAGHSATTGLIVWFGKVYFK